MRPEITRKESYPQKRRSNFELFYYERVGSRYYLRFTRLTIILVAGLTIVSVVILLIFFLLADHRDASKGVNVNITTPQSSPNPSNQTIIQPAPARQPKPIKQPTINVPAPSLQKDGTNNALSNIPAQAKSNRNNNE